MRYQSRWVRRIAPFIVVLVIAVVALGASHNSVATSPSYTGPTCQPHSSRCYQSAGSGPWIPGWYYFALINTQSPGSTRGYVPSVFGRQPSSQTEEDDGASDEEAEDQQKSQSAYVNTPADESSEGQADATEEGAADGSSANGAAGSSEDDPASGAPDEDEPEESAPSSSSAGDDDGGGDGDE